MLTNKGNSTENKYLKLCCDSEIPRCSISHYLFTNLMMLMHPILVSGPVIRLSPVAEEDGGRDAQGDEQDAHHDGRDDTAAAGVPAPAGRGLVAADDLVDVVVVALRHELVRAVVAVRNTVAQPGPVHAGAGHCAPELPPLKCAEYMLIVTWEQ